MKIQEDGINIMISQVSNGWIVTLLAPKESQTYIASTIRVSTIDDAMVSAKEIALDMLNK